jgi:hypothetical protein
MSCGNARVTAWGELRHRGFKDANIYDPTESSVGGVHAFFVILGQPEAYNFPPAPEVPTIHLKRRMDFSAGLRDYSFRRRLRGFRVFGGAIRLGSRKNSEWLSRTTRTVRDAPRQPRSGLTKYAARRPRRGEFLLHQAGAGHAARLP